MPLDQVDVDKLAVQEAEMGFLDHLEALRWHLLRAALAVVVLTVLIFFAKDFVFGTVIFGPTKPDFITYRLFCQLGEYIGATDTLCMKVEPVHWITPIFGETFIIHMQVSLILGLVVASPYVFFEIWGFVRPGLLKKEQDAARGTVFICSILFMMGVMFGYYVISPFAVSFLVNYELPGVDPSPALSSYITYLTMFTVPTGLVFELPVLVYFLTKIGLVTSTMMKSYRRHAFVVLLVISGLVTPPDPITLVLLSMPLYALYEAGILIATRVERRQAADEARELAQLN